MSEYSLSKLPVGYREHDHAEKVLPRTNMNRRDWLYTNENAVEYVFSNCFPSSMIEFQFSSTFLYLQLLKTSLNVLGL